MLVKRPIESKEKVISRKEIQQAIKEKIITTPIPARTRTYTPISHESILNTIYHHCENHNFKILDESFMVDSTGNKVTGKITLEMGDNEMGAMLGFQNSYDKSLSGKFAIGSSIFICSNGMVVGDFPFKTKHQGTADTNMLSYIGDAIGATRLKFGDSVILREDMKKIRFSEQSLNELIGKLFMQQDILQVTQLNMLQKEYNKVVPKHDYGVHKNNLWNIYNLCTDTIESKGHPSNYFSAHEKLTNFIKAEYLN
jgi:hypothetical protein